MDFQGVRQLSEHDFHAHFFVWKNKNKQITRKHARKVSKQILPAVLWNTLTFPQRIPLFFILTIVYNQEMTRGKLRQLEEHGCRNWLRQLGEPPVK